MNIIKDAIVRVGKSSRLLKESKKQVKCQFPRNQQSEGEDAIVEVAPLSADLRSSNEMTKRYQKRVFSNFLEPLGIENLKSFDEKMPSYDSAAASSNWNRKKGKTAVQMFDRLMEDRNSFSKMLDELVSITPKYLKNGSIPNGESLQRVVEQSRFLDSSADYSNLVPRYYFNEIPPIPLDSKEAFEKYIYTLTHSKVLYKNSSSLKNGIIPDILLHTHKLTNTDFKHLRSRQTYNYLIKYFGYDKNQSSFARELILVMNKDGHKPNIVTINNLLKMCSTHSHIRSLTSTYDIITRYLKLCRKLRIEINLTTWNRVYDSIDNIFLKEQFINKIVSINLPISRNLYLRIIDDYMETCTDTADLIRFIEGDLELYGWQKDWKVRGKVLLHKAKNIKLHEFESLWEFLNNLEHDDSLYKFFFEGIYYNFHLSPIHKERIAMKAYASFDQNLLVNPDSYKYLLRILCYNGFKSHPKEAGFLLRCLIYDAIQLFKLPGDIQKYGDQHSPPESYKIIRRLVGKTLMLFEAKYTYVNENEHESLPALSAPLNEEEIEKYANLKTSIHKQDWGQFIDVGSNLDSGSHKTYHVPASFIEHYMSNQKYKIEQFRKDGIKRKLQLGEDKFLEDEMRSRKILTPHLSSVPMENFSHFQASK